MSPDHLLIVIGVLLVSLLIVAGGKGIADHLPSFKKIFGRDELGDDVRKTKECDQCGLIVDPNKCPLHANEHERSLRNEQGIRDVTAKLEDSRKQLFGKLEGIEVVLTEIKVAVAKLVVERNYQMDQRKRTEREFD